MTRIAAKVILSALLLLLLSATPASAKVIKVWAVGDAADGKPASVQVADMIKSRDPDVFLYLGDVYDTGTAEEYANNYDPIYGQIAGITRPTVGNHEWDNRHEGYNPYWENALGIPRMWKRKRFELGSWEVFSLNSEAPHHAGSSQEEWLKSRVADGGTCRIAFVHQPRYSAGKKGDERHMAPLFDPLRNRARLFLAGDDHNSQLLRPVDGVHSFVAGGGGRGLYPVNDLDPRLKFHDDTQHAALRIVLDGREARYAFVSAEGKTLYSDRRRCRSE